MVLGIAPAGAQDGPPLPTLPQSAEIELKVQRDGALSVTEAISVPADAHLTRRVPLRVPAGNDRDRVLAVRDVAIEGRGDSDAEVTEDEFTVRLGGGTSVVRYTVDGAVGAAGDSLEVSWPLAGGWDGPLKLLRASFAAPKIPKSVRCSLDGTWPCLAAQIDHAGLTRFSQQNLAPGTRMDATVVLPPGTVPANAHVVPAATLAGAFVLTTPVALAWAGFAVVCAAVLGMVLRARRRVRTPPGPVELGAGDGRFSSPDGVLPGQVGTLLHGELGPAELPATVLDLAVRNYLWVRDEPDWLLERRNEPDEQLTGYERLVFDALFADSTSVPLSRAEVALGPMRDELYAELVRRRWFTRPPGTRTGRLFRAGVRIGCYGVFLTVLLALTAGYAQAGLALAASGAVLALGGLLLPVRTPRGDALADLLGRLRLDVDSDRALPYAVALGETPELPSRERYWIAGADAGAFVDALVGAFAGSGQGRRQ
ncbi:DUF2207 family protein [Amycolatopsis nigrescens]|uniref:DUF2207 family protein n=1 Tax=Amycolatopsis nigrescens TaxID=381445 RepID=UPI0003780803|nr:DUF2207 domain-containing protein [Amycolatopsis nigrescens]